jgi:hypothetical protein
VYYIGVKFDPEGSTRPRSLQFLRAANAPVEPEEMRNFRRECNQVLAIVLLVFEDHEAARVEALRDLHLAAHTGTVGPEPDVPGGKDNLTELKETIRNDAHYVRSAYLRRYLWSLILFLFLLVLGGVIFMAASTDHHLFELSWYGKFPKAPTSKGVEISWDAVTSISIALFWIPAGAIFGVLLEFIVRTNSLTYEKIADFNPGRWRPLERFLVVFVSAYFLAFVVGLKIFEIGVVSYLLSDFLGKQPIVSILVGFVTGFSLPVVLDIFKRVSPEARQ